MLCPWCHSEISARKDHSIFFCPECNKPVGFDLNGDFVRIVRARELHSTPDHANRKHRQLTWGDLNER